jgi:hypothetical protein
VDKPLGVRRFPIEQDRLLSAVQGKGQAGEAQLGASPA